METETEMVMKEFSELRDFLQTRVVTLDDYNKQIELDSAERVKVGEAIETIHQDLKRIKQMQVARVEDGRLRVPTGRWAGMDFLGLSIAEKVLNERRRVDERTSVKLLQEIYQARKTLYDCITVDTILKWEDNAIQRLRAANPRADGRVAQGFADKVLQWRSAMVPMVARAMDSTTAGSGDELVPTFEAAELWMDVNLDTLVLPLLMQTAMPTNPFDIPTQLGDTNWYPATENIQGTTTDLSTAKTTLTAYGLKTGVPFSDELEEDAIISTAAEIRAGLVRNAAEIIDDVLVNADTTGTNNINADGATITSSTAGSAQWLIGFDGIIHAAIVDASAAMSADHSGVAPTAAGYNQAMRKLGKYATARRPGELVYLTDPNTAIASMTIAEVETMDVFGGRATISAGELAGIYGVPIVRSEQMLMADVDGKVTSGGNTTNTGRIVCFNTSQWRVGFRRAITLEPDREPGKNQTTLYVTFRMALAMRDSTRANQRHTSILYHIGSVT